MGRKAKPRTQLELLNLEIRAARKRPRTSTAAIAKLLRLRQQELDRLALLGINGETTRETLSTKQPESEQTANPVFEPSDAFSELVRSGSEPEPVRMVDAAKESELDSSLSEETQEHADAEVSRESAIERLIRSTPSELRGEARFQLVGDDGVAFGPVMNFKCESDYFGQGKTVHHVEVLKTKHHAIINPVTHRWLGLNGKDMPSAAEIARRQRITDAHLTRLAHEEDERLHTLPKLQCSNTWDIAKMYGTREQWGLPALMPQQSESGQLDYSSGRLNREQEQDQENRRQVEADRSARNSGNPWQKEGY